MDRTATLAEFIKNEVIRNGDARLDEKEDLIETGTLDSLAILQLVAYITEAFGIEVPDEDVVYENFHSVEAINGYLQKYS